MSWEPTVEKDFYLVRDLCAVTGLGKASVYDGIRKGELPGYKVGERYVIPGPAFRAFVEGSWLSPKARLESLKPREGQPDRFVVNLEDRRNAG